MYHLPPSRATEGLPDPARAISQVSPAPLLLPLAPTLAIISIIVSSIGQRSREWGGGEILCFAQIGTE